MEGQLGALKYTRYSLEQAQAEFQRVGSVLLSETYEGVGQNLTCLCIDCRQNSSSITMNSLRKGRLPRCAGCLLAHFRQKAGPRRNAFHSVQQDFEARGLVLLSVDADYLNANSRLSVKCVACPAEVTLSYNQLRREQTPRCSACSRKHRVAVTPTGENSPRWNPDLTDEDRSLRRHYPWYREWEEQALERFGYRCAVSKERGTLAVHHLYNWADFLKLRQHPHNAVVLTKPIHLLYHQRYDYRHNTLSQFEDFYRERLGYKYHHTDPSMQGY